VIGYCLIFGARGVGMAHGGCIGCRFLLCFSPHYLYRILTPHNNAVWRARIKVEPVRFQNH
jgi:hypothetical protein